MNNTTNVIIYLVNENIRLNESQSRLNKEISKNGTDLKIIKMENSSLLKSESELSHRLNALHKHCKRIEFDLETKTRELERKAPSSQYRVVGYYPVDFAASRTIWDEFKNRIFSMEAAIDPLRYNELYRISDYCINLIHLHFGHRMISFNSIKKVESGYASYFTCEVYDCKSKWYVDLQVFASFKGASIKCSSFCSHFKYPSYSVISNRQVCKLFIVLLLHIYFISFKTGLHHICVIKNERNTSI